MKVLITGASGMIGGEALVQCLDSPKVSQVVAFVRRNLPADDTQNAKLKCVTIKDFSKWPQDVLKQHADASGMIWYARCRPTQKCLTPLG
jgi:nucleoside-diphosphate-sugar epimerase